MNGKFCLRTKVLNEILIKEVWGTLTKMKIPLVEKSYLSKVKMKPLSKQYFLKSHYYAYTVRKLDTLSLDATLGSQKGLNLKGVGL